MGDDFLPPVKTEFIIDDGSDVGVIKRTQDTTPILEDNKRLQNEPQKDIGDGWVHTHEIPCIIVEEWIRLHEANLLLAKWDQRGKPLNDHAVKVARLLNSPEYAWLRVSKYKTPLVSK